MSIIKLITLVALFFVIYFHYVHKIMRVFQEKQRLFSFKNDFPCFDNLQNLSSLLPYKYEINVLLKLTFNTPIQYPFTLVLL